FHRRSNCPFPACGILARFVRDWPPREVNRPATNTFPLAAASERMGPLGFGFQSRSRAPLNRLTLARPERGTPLTDWNAPARKTSLPETNTRSTLPSVSGVQV